MLLALLSIYFPQRIASSIMLLDLRTAFDIAHVSVIVECYSCLISCLSLSLTFKLFFLLTELELFSSEKA